MIIAITQQGHNASHSQNVSAASRTAFRTTLTLNKIIFLPGSWLSTLSLCVVWQSLWPLSHVADGYVCVWAQARSCSCCCAMINGNGVFNGPLCTLVVIFQSWVQGWLRASHPLGPVCTKKQAKNRNHWRAAMRTNSYFIQTQQCWSVQKPFPQRRNYSSNLKEQDRSSCLEARGLISLLVWQPNPIQISARLATAHKEGILMGLALGSLLVATGLHSQGLDGMVFTACANINTSSWVSLPLWRDWVTPASGVGWHVMLV